jgi:hypothetical protein
VPPAKRKARLAVMVELPEPPPIGIVAELAARAETALVHVAHGMTRITRRCGFLEFQTGMTLFARGQAVEAQERESGELVIELHTTRPARLIMARLTAIPLLTAVNVVGEMAGGAFPGNLLLLDVAAMAAAARLIPVRSLQLEACVSQMVETTLLPAIRGVTPGAVLAEVSTMKIIRLMTSNAARVRSPLRPGRLAGIDLARMDPSAQSPMASRTGGSPVTAAQREISLLVVVEGGSLPARRFVAADAAGAEASAMYVVRCVAVTASRRGILVGLTRVADRAVDLPMFSRKTEVRRVVVEACVFPVAFGMASRTVASETTAMTIVSLMAIAAADRRLSVLLACRVAAPTRDPGVGALQSRIRQRMIEGIHVQPDDVSGSALVLAMAVATRRRRDRGLPAVEAHPSIDIACDGLVASEAEPFLGLALEWTMATPAAAFDIGMPLDHGPRHDHPFEVDGVARTRLERRQDGK